MSTEYEMAWQDADDYCKNVSENSALVEILSVEVTYYFSIDYRFEIFHLYFSKWTTLEYY